MRIEGREGKGWAWDVGGAGQNFLAVRALSAPCRRGGPVLSRTRMLRIVPLGGLGEIGLNLLVLETEDEAILVDCGILFPREAPGIDRILPDFTYLRTIRDKLRGAVLTHGHEDHIGALPHLLREFDIPVWGSGLTLAFLSRRLEEAGVVGARLWELEAGGVVRPGRDFSVEAVRVTHSVPDAFGLSIETPEGRIVHTGDFKIDPTPLGPPTDLERLSELGRDGVLALLSDSTNAERPGRTPSERAVGEALAPIFAEAEGRILVATFASNLHRIQQILDLSERHGRRVALFGRAIETNVMLAMQTGHLRARPELFVEAEAVSGRRKREVTILASGAQGEPRSAMTRLAMGGEGLPFRLDAGDTAILSASAIPGNEVAVAAVLDALALQGVHTFHGERVHASGHASQQEQLQMIETVQPRHFVPVHGEGRHLVRHRQTAIAAGVEEDRAHLLLDGQVLAFSEGRATRASQVPAGRLYLDRLSGQMVEEDLVAERLLLGELGVVIAAVVVDATGGVVQPPGLVARGLAAMDAALERSLQEEIVRALSGMEPARRRDGNLVEDEVRLAVRRAYKRATGRRPLVLPVVIEI